MSRFSHLRWLFGLLFIATFVSAAPQKPAPKRGTPLTSRGQVVPPVVMPPKPTPRPTRVPTPRPVPTPTAVPLRTFPFALPAFDSSRTATDVSSLNDMPAGKLGFVTTRGEHFVDGGGRTLRFWGVNLNFAGVFPPKSEAPKIAARLAKFGFNSARIHHFEGYAAPSGIWKAYAVGSSRIAIPREFDPEQVDRMDFFMSELIKHGIYLDFNLHVGRKVMEGEGVKSPSRLPEKDKGINFFDPDLQKLSNDFARQLLTHVNPYTKRAYKDEPGVCAVEVSNENSLLGMWLNNEFKAGPEASQMLQEKWNAWLNKRYSEVTLRRAWTEIDEPIKTTNILAGELPFDVINPDAPDAKISIASKTLDGPFSLATVTGAQGTLVFDRVSGPTVDGFVRPGLTANLQKTGTVTWAFQMNRDGLDLQDGHPYTLSFWARSDLRRTISVNLWQDQMPRRFGGFTGYANLTPDWQKFTFTFRPTNPDPNHSRLSWNFGNVAGQVQLGEIELFEGGRIAAPSEWTLSSGIPLLDFKNTQVMVARRDYAEFLGEIERDWVRGSRKYLRDLGVRVPIWHTQAQFGGWGGVSREMLSDVIDAHAYWKHPNLGGDGWSGASWTVENKSMTGAGGIDPLSAFSLLRVPGKPFVMTEWNAGQPSDFGAESLVMAAAFAAWQDWAGIWVFDYHSAGPYDRDHFEGFFSIDSHPVKMATAPTAALLFRRPDKDDRTGEFLPGDVKVAADSATTTLNVPLDTLWLEVANAPGPPTAAPIVKTWNQAGGARTAPLTGKVYAQIGSGVFATASRSMLDDGSTKWSSDSGQIKWNNTDSLWSLNTPRTKILAGSLGGRRMELDEWSVDMPPSKGNYATWALTSLDNREIPASRRLLLTVAGRAENLDMGWNAQRTSVGAQWGNGPTRVEGITGRVEILGDNRDWQVWALDTTGARMRRLPSLWRNGALSFAALPDYQTLWYEIATP